MRIWEILRSSVIADLCPFFWFGFTARFFLYVSSFSVVLFYLDMFVHVRDMDVQVMRPCFFRSLLGYLCPGCGRVFILFSCARVVGLSYLRLLCLVTLSVGFGFGGSFFFLDN